jgi:prevent-host-death family protein
VARGEDVVRVPGRADRPQVLEHAGRVRRAKLLARVEAGEDVEIARNGVPVARLVRIEPPTPGMRFLALAGDMADSIRIGDDFEFTEEELDQMLNNPVDRLA